jgi:catechol 2,3-dioxygenase-like lactoylglutathione lyase family enzyme
MHRSRIGAVPHRPQQGPRRRRHVLGAGDRATPEPDESPEFTLLGHVGSASLAMQRTGAGTPGRVHLDVQTDDVRAELARLTRHGARVVEDHGEHAALEDPAGLVFCVVPVQTGQRFEAEATTWD